MNNGVIIKAMSGFYYVKTDSQILTCKARGKFKHEGMSPLVGDRVCVSDDGLIVDVLERINSFIRPAVANIDLLVFVASNTIPVTDPFLIDRVGIIAQSNNCDFAVCINKSDIDYADYLFDIYSNSGLNVVRTSAETGEGLPELKQILSGKISAFTGNSGVGKSSILNSLIPDACIETADVSSKLGRGKHITRHVEFFALDDNTFIADTPGFASFDIDMMNEITLEQLPNLFPDFLPYLNGCRFNDCQHINEPGCILKDAVNNGKVQITRYESYLKLYDIIKNHKSWD